MEIRVLTRKAQQRVAVIEGVVRGELTMAEADRVLGVSERQRCRIMARRLQEGGQGVIHGHRGRSSP